MSDIPGYVGLESTGTDGCVACQCGIGAALPTCDEATATCTCLPGVAGPLCEACSPGTTLLLALLLWKLDISLDFMLYHPASIYLDSLIDVSDTVLIEFL